MSIARRALPDSRSCRRSGLDGDGLVAAFSFFLFLLYGTFTFVLARNRSAIVEGALRASVWLWKASQAWRGLMSVRRFPSVAEAPPLPPTPQADPVITPEDVKFAPSDDQPVSV
jgi:hypothetical protein